jgi:hypothetical protein
MKKKSWEIYKINKYLTNNIKAIVKKVWIQNLIL